MNNLEQWNKPYMISGIGFCFVILIGVAFKLWTESFSTGILSIAIPSIFGGGAIKSIADAFRSNAPEQPKP